MKDIQKFIWMLVIVTAFALVFPFLKSIFLARTYGATELPEMVLATWGFLSVSIVALQNIVSAFWLRHLAIKNQIGASVWFAFGLFFGLIAVAIFYLVQIIERREI